MATNIIFKLDERNLPVIEPAALTIPELNALWLRDNSEYKDAANTELTYVYHMVDERSPYFMDYVDKKLAKVKKLNDIYFNGEKPDAEVNKAVRFYEEFVNSRPDRRSLRSVIGVIQKLSDYFDNIDFNEIDAQGRYVHNPKDVIAVVAKLEDVFKTLKDLETKIDKNAIGKSTKNMGSSGFNMFDEEEFS